MGYFGRAAQKSVEHLLRQNLVHLLASDGHSSTENRPPVMAEARDAVERLVGGETAHTLAVANPSAILADAPVAIPVIRPVRRRLFPRLRR